MRFTSLWAENWRSFGPRRDIQLTPVTLLIGPNNAGKSNILGLPMALSEFVSTGPSAFTNEHGLERHFRTGTDVLRLGLGFRSSDTAGFYALELNRSGRWKEQYQDPVVAFTVDSGELRVEQSPQGRSVSTLGERSGLAWAQKAHRDPANRQWTDGPVTLANELRTYDLWRCRPDVMNEQAQVERRPLVGSHGEHAAAVLDHLRDRYPANYAALQDDLRRCAPEVERVVAEASDPGKKEIYFHERGGVITRCRWASEGLKFLLFVLLIVHSPTPPSVLAFEEVEHGVHPSRLKDIVAFLRQLASSSASGPQILLTSHSPLVLDQFRDTPNEVIVVERKDGATTTSRLDERLQDLQGNTGGAALGDLWYSGVLGGVPSS